MLSDDLARRMASVVVAFFAITSLLIVFLHLLQSANWFYYDIYCDIYYDIPLFWSLLHQKYTLQNHAICANMKSRERSDGRTYMTVKPPLVVSLGRFFHAQRNPQYPFGVCKRYSYHARLFLCIYWYHLLSRQCVGCCCDMPGSPQKAASWTELHYIHPHPRQKLRGFFVDFLKVFRKGV